MNYLESTMLPGEYVVAWTRLHKVIFAIPIVICIAALIVAAAANQIAVFGVALIFIFLFAAWCYLQYKSVEIAITNRRLLLKAGIIRRRTVELLPNKIESFSFYQGILGRMFNWGTLFVTGIGATKAAFPLIENPLGFYLKVHEVIGWYMQLQYQSGAAWGTSSPGPQAAQPM